MNPSSTRRWLRYWRNSLADGERMQVNINRALAKAAVDPADLEGGTLPQPTVAHFFEAKERQLRQRRRKRKKPAGEPPVRLSSVDLSLAPFALLQRVEHGMAVHDAPRVLYPFWIPASLDREGHLHPPAYPFPRVIRQVLEPVVDAATAVVLSDVDTVDEVLAALPWEYPSWEAYWQHCQEFFEAISGQPFQQLAIPGQAVRHEGMAVTDDQVKGASFNIVQLYDRLHHRQTFPPLLSRLIHPSAKRSPSLLTASEQAQQAIHHLGHMSPQFSLSRSQRFSLHHCMALHTGELQAVNGPPGTGKTTLIQSLVAQLTVERAIEGSHPCVVVATSTNNQAVTNIIERFAADQADPREDVPLPLAQRWLPGLDSFAMYLPASRKNVPADIQYTKVKGGGLPEQMENAPYLEEAKTYFLEQCQVYAGQAFEEVTDALVYLRQSLLKLQEHIQLSVHALQAIEQARKLFRVYGGSSGRLYLDWLLKAGDLQGEQHRLEQLLSQWKLKREPSLRGMLDLLEAMALLHPALLSWVKRFRRFPLQHPDLLHTAMEQWLQGRLDLLEAALQAQARFQRWLEVVPYSGSLDDLSDWLDRHLRHQAFWLATHYWEGRWLQEVAPLLKGDLLRRNGKTAMERRWRRYAMLTPCFVSTFYMLPRFFQYTFYQESYETAPMLNFIDLLIVDEAGQVAPEVGVASFALARRAVAVGDTYQIPPVWKLTRPVDLANLQRFEHIHGPDDLEAINRHLNHGVMASSGSVMKMALRASRYHLPLRQEGGLFLAEHRRCYDGIIAYCNTLAYRGALLPLRGTPRQQLLPMMGHQQVEGRSQFSGGSRLNHQEAQALVMWLAQHRAAIEGFYRNHMAAPLEIEELVGIITPFAAQGRLLRQALRELQFDVARMKVGTVHSLQGAERAIVLFSPVYGINNLDMTFFFDRNVHMLNVAVSRARDSFLVFGDRRIFDPDSGTPSGLLAQHLFAQPEHDLAGWDLSLLAREKRP